MKKLRIYLDTSVINFLFADDSPDFRKATEDFFMNNAKHHELAISSVVLAEIEADPDETHRNLLKGVIKRYAISRLPDDHLDSIEILANAYLDKGAIPPSKYEDGLHVAYATVHSMDILFSWNFKHLANVRKEERFLAINMEMGYSHPMRIVSPMEAIYG